MSGQTRRVVRGRAANSVLLGLTVSAGILGAMGVGAMGGWWLRSHKLKPQGVQKAAIVRDEGRARTPGDPALGSRPSGAPVDVVASSSAALAAADQQYKADTAHAKSLFSSRLDAAGRIDSGSDWAASITSARKILDDVVPDPAVGVHHAESPQWPPKPLESQPFTQPEIQAIVISYKSDLELARQRWINAVIAARKNDLAALTDRLNHVQKSENDDGAKQLRAILDRLTNADKEKATTWYREPAPTDASGKPAMRSIPVALEIRNVQIGPAIVGEQLRGSLDVHTLVAPYTVRADLPGPDYILMLYEGDEIIYLAGGAWNGTHEVGSSMRENWDTHSNTLAAGGVAFLIPREGSYTVRLVAINGGGWDDILDVYETTLKSVSAHAPMPVRPKQPPRAH